jgi:putative tryptophan/tyrosine transport system substrate-binding protein
MKRREFITLLGGGAVSWPLAASAQQPGKLPTIGYLGTTTASAWKPWTAAFVHRLRELGWIEGTNLAVEYRWAEAHSERFTEIAVEFVRQTWMSLSPVETRPSRLSTRLQWPR